MAEDDDKKRGGGTVYRVHPGSEEVLGRSTRRRRKSARPKTDGDSLKSGPGEPSGTHAASTRRGRSGHVSGGPSEEVLGRRRGSSDGPGRRTSGAPSDPPMVRQPSSSGARRSVDARKLPSVPPSATDLDFGEFDVREETDPRAEVFRAYRGKSQRPVPRKNPDSREVRLDQLPGRDAGDGRLDPEYERKVRERAGLEREEFERSVYSSLPPPPERTTASREALSEAGWETSDPAIAAGFVAPSGPPAGTLGGFGGHDIFEAPTEPRRAALPDRALDDEVSKRLRSFSEGASLSTPPTGLPAEPRIVGVTRRRDTGRPVFEERLPGSALDAVGTASIRPSGPIPGPPPELRARKILLQLREVGPEDEGAAVQHLVALGAAALGEVAREWPGLLWFNRAIAHRAAPRGRDCSPLARVLFAFGREAVPTVVALLRNIEPDARYYAALVGLDLADHLEGEPRETLLRALIERLDDDDPGVRGLAGDAVSRFRNVRELGPALRALEGALTARAASARERLRALQAFARLRQTKVAPDVIELLGCVDPEVASAARQFLRLLTAEDLGAYPDPWRKWWSKNGKRDRVRWLLDGLLADELELRGLAHRELTYRLGADPGGFEGELADRDRRQVRRRWERVLRDRGDL